LGIKGLVVVVVVFQHGDTGRFKQSLDLLYIKFCTLVQILILICVKL
jgi:hypothetical protein